MSQHSERISHRQEHLRGLVDKTFPLNREWPDIVDKTLFASNLINSVSEDFPVDVEADGTRIDISFPRFQDGSKTLFLQDYGGFGALAELSTILPEEMGLEPEERCLVIRGSDGPGGVALKLAIVIQTVHSVNDPAPKEINNTKFGQILIGINNAYPGQFPEIQEYCDKHLL